MSVDTLVGALLLTLIPLWVSARLLRRRPRQLLWLACALILAGAGCLVATGAAEDIGRSAGEFVSAYFRKSVAQARATHDQEKSLGLMIIMMPIALVVGGLVVWFRLWQRWSMFFLAMFALNACAFLVYATPIPETLARRVLPDEVLKASGRQFKPDHRIK